MKQIEKLEQVEFSKCAMCQDTCTYAGGAYKVTFTDGSDGSLCENCGTEIIRFFGIPEEDIKKIVI